MNKILLLLFSLFFMSGCNGISPKIEKKEILVEKDNIERIKVNAKIENKNVEGFVYKIYEDKSNNIILEYNKNQEVIFKDYLYNSNLKEDKTKINITKKKEKNININLKAINIKYSYAKDNYYYIDNIFKIRIKKEKNGFLFFVQNKSEDNLFIKNITIKYNNKIFKLNINEKLSSYTYEDSKRIYKIRIPKKYMYIEKINNLKFSFELDYINEYFDEEIILIKKFNRDKRI